MTQEEKAKRFDEVIDKAEALYKAAEPMSGCNVIIETLFPELKESEDEKIRKALIDYFKWNSDGQLLNEFSNREVFSWLEKQGEQKPIRPVWKYKKDNTPLLRDSLILNKYWCVAKSPSGALVSDVWVIDFEELAKLPKEEVEKQGEHRDILEDAILDSNKDGLIAETIHCKKLANKVEPKFKVGDWISGYYTNYKVLSVNNDGYLVEDVDGNKINILFENEKFHHLFTIQDAKDGDVLCCESGWTCIFKKLNHNSFGEILFDSYCFIDRTGWFCDGAKGHTLNERINGKIYPATKEQGDLLFAKMKEAGYEWDAEKKELKKIEQKPAETENTTWSEEDEDIINRLLTICVVAKTYRQFAGCSQEDVTKYQIWLKSLKDKYTWKPSDAQVASINCAVRKMKESACYDSELVHLLQDLKKLREE